VGGGLLVWERRRWGRRLTGSLPLPKKGGKRKKLGYFLVLSVANLRAGETLAITGADTGERRKELGGSLNFADCVCIEDGSNTAP